MLNVSPNISKQRCLCHIGACQPVQIKHLTGFCIERALLLRGSIKFGFGAGFWTCTQICSKFWARGGPGACAAPKEKRHLCGIDQPCSAHRWWCWNRMTASSVFSSGDASAAITCSCTSSFFCFRSMAVCHGTAPCWHCLRMLQNRCPQLPDAGQDGCKRGPPSPATMVA